MVHINRGLRSLHTLSRSSLNSFYWRWVRRRWWHFGNGLEWSRVCRSCKTTLWWWWCDRRSGHWSGPWWFRRTLSRFFLLDAFIQTQTLKWKMYFILLFTYTAGRYSPLPRVNKPFAILFRHRHQTFCFRLPFHRMHLHIFVVAVDDTLLACF